MNRGNGIVIIGALTLALATPSAAQSDEDARLAAGARVVEVEFAPDRLELRAGERIAVPEIRLLDAAGTEVDAMYRLVARGVAELDDGAVTASEAGAGQLVAFVMTPPDYEGDPVAGSVPVDAAWPAVTEVDVSASDRLYERTSVRHTGRALHADGTERPDATFTWASSNPDVATVDAFGNVEAKRPGHVVITASFGGVEGSVEHRVAAFPARSLELELTHIGGTRAADDRSVRAHTGDVLTFDAVARADDAAVEDLPITWSFTYVPDEGIEAPGAAGTVRAGKFVGEQPGLYTVLASAGPLTALRTVRLEERDVVRPVRVVGQGAVTHVHTSDIWPFEGADGRDYAVTGTWGGDGWAYFWDITDPGGIVKVDSIQVDARTVNDVKVSPTAGTRR